MSILEHLSQVPLFPLTAEGELKTLDKPTVPEPPRAGEVAEGCETCAATDDTYLWADEHWRLKARARTSFPGGVFLETRAHHDSFADLPAELQRELGPMLARIESALLAGGDVGRVHLNRWGDGSGHFHLWVMPRPLGAMQLRGWGLTLWDLLSPDAPESEVTARLDAFLAAFDDSAGQGS